MTINKKDLKIKLKKVGISPDDLTALKNRNKDRLAIFKTDNFLQDIEPEEKGIDILPEFMAYEQEQRDAYTMIRQDSTTNALIRVSSKSDIEAVEFTNTGIIKTSNGKTDLQVIIQEYGKTTLKQSTSKLLRLLTINFTEEGSRSKVIKIPLRQVMEDLGLKDIKTARSNIKKDLEALYNVSCEAHRENRKKGEKDYIKFRILDMQGIKNGIVFVNLSDAIFTHLRNCELMPYNKNLLKIESNSQKNPYAFYLGDKITELMKYNQYDRTTGEQKPYFITTVKTLLEVCIANGMKRYENIQTGSRHVDKLIITPFERDLDTCSANFFDWEYCNEKGTPLRPEQTDDRTPAGKYKAQTYKEFESLHIKITPKAGYPVQEVNKKRLNRDSNKKAKKPTK